MIPTLYKMFQHWSAAGSVYIISDTHFDDPDCTIMNPDWITPEEQIKRINSVVTRNDTLVHLGDVGNPEWMKQVKCEYRVLILGNHDKGKQYYEPYFYEIYDGALMIAQKILLSHEPILTLVNGSEIPVMNLHGHCHGEKFDKYLYERNFCADVINYTPISLGKLIKDGLLSDIRDIHKITVHYASANNILEKTKNEETWVRRIGYID